MLLTQRASPRTLRVLWAPRAQERGRCVESTSPAGPGWQPRQASRSGPGVDVLPLACEFPARPWSTAFHSEPGYEASASTWK